MGSDYYSSMKNILKSISSFGTKKMIFALLCSVLFVGVLVVGCGKKSEPAAEQSQIDALEVQPEAEVNVPDENTVSIDVNDVGGTNLVSYDVVTTGRPDPFMPYGEMEAYEDAKSAAYAEANAFNAKIAQIEKMRNTVIREPDDISPYSFNLPVPPTSLASPDAAAAKITRTKVVGIMYNKTSPSAIINVDEKDYLVRQGDKIIGQEYKVVEINPSWITVSLGSNVYSASIGEMFSRDEFDKTQNDLYNLRSRFGGRKG